MYVEVNFSEIPTSELVDWCVKAPSWDWYDPDTGLYGPDSLGELFERYGFLEIPGVTTASDAWELLIPELIEDGYLDGNYKY